MDPNGRRDKTRRIVIITLSAAIAGLTTALAASYERIGMGLAVAIGYIILFMSAALVNSFLHNSASDTKRMLCLVFSICVLLLFLGGMAYLLFNQKDDETIKPEITEEIIIPETVEEIEEETAEPDEIAIPSAPQVMWTVRIDDSSPHPVSEEPSDEISLQDEKSPRDSSETTAVIDSDNASSESAALIPDDPIFIGSMIRSIEDEIPSVPVFIESSVKAVEKDPAAIPDTPIFIEASIDEVKKDEIPVVPVIIGGADAETEILIEEPVVEESTTKTPSDSNNNFFSGLSPEEADFWADFYIAGEDELELADGNYYMGIYANGGFLGSISTTIENGNVSISSNELLIYISDFLTEDAIKKIFASATPMISLDYLENTGVGTRFVSDEYNIYLTFSSEDMPIQILSISDSNTRFRSRPISGAEELDSAVFVLRSNYTLSTDFDIYPFESFVNSLDFRFAVSNYARLYDVHFDFNYSMDFDFNSFYFNLDFYRFYSDLSNDGLRLYWGNINTDLLSRTGSIGIKLEKDASYAPASIKRRSQIERTINIEKESDVQIFNEGKEIFRRTLTPGNYRLTDFILYSGANRIEIIIKPLDGSPEIRYEMDVNYLSSLLAPGEIYYSIAVTTNRYVSPEAAGFFEGGFRLPWLNGMSLEYDFRNVTISGTVDAGLSSTLTMNLIAAVQNKVSGSEAWNPSAELSLSFTHANALGSTRYNFRLKECKEDGVWLYPYIYANIGQQISTGIPQLNMVSLGLTYTMSTALEHEIKVSASVSGRFGIFSWSASVSGGYDDGTIPWALSGSLSVSPIRNLRVSLNARIDGKGLDTPVFTGRAYVSWMFGKGSVSANASMDDYMVSVNAYDDRNSFYAAMNGTPMLQPDNYDANASYSYSGDYVGVSVGLNAYDFISSRRRFTGSATLHTSSVFADGLIAFSNGIPENFLLVRQDKVLRGNEISIGVPSSSSTNKIPLQFGTALYKNVSPGSNIAVYSTSSNSFLNSSSYNLRIPEAGEEGYVYRIKADELYSVSGVVHLPDGSLWLNGASPVYSYSEEEESCIFSNTDYYLFTDSDGRFVLSGIPVGTYAFDVPYGEDWITVIFEVESNISRMGDIQLLGEPSGYSINVSEPYVFAMHMDNTGFIETEEFWNLLYPSEGVVNE